VKAPIAVALDVQELPDAVALAAAVAPTVSTIKVGLELYLRAGASGVQQVRAAAAGCSIFLDLKLHDIPNTVAGAARSVGHLEPDLFTVHALGGFDMIRAAVDALPATRVAGVTILTSMSVRDLAAVGVVGSAEDAVRRLAMLAVTAGARALVCSPLEVGLVRAEVGEDIVLITPGVRFSGADTGDQMRVATPGQAIADGADLLVVGRPISAAPDPAAAAAAIAKSLVEAGGTLPTGPFTR
jgi:orotidine-5'-phosphate decarboxylase